MNITPELLASLPPELQREMQRRLFALLDDLGVQPMISPDGERVYNIAEIAPALGMSIEQAMAIAEEAGPLQAIDPATLRPLQ